MGEVTAISWCDHTFNPWVGCQKISPACDGCYAAALMEDRFGRVTFGGPGKGIGTRQRTSAGNWHQPVKWNRAAAQAGTRPFVFCASLADVFDKTVPEEWRRDLFALIRATPHLVWLLLTKRPGNIARMADAAGGLPPNAAIGSTVEDQRRADINVPDLLYASEELWRAKTKPLFTFLSCEPLLGPIDLTAFEDGTNYRTDALMGKTWIPAGTNTIPGTSNIRGDRDYVSLCHHVDWVITGGETDQGAHKARPSHPDWFRALRDQCAAAGVPFHHKQNGEWLGGDQIPEEDVIPSGISNDCGIAGADDNRRVWRVGKARAGRLLDGAEHLARPAVPALPRAS